MIGFIKNWWRTKHLFRYPYLQRFCEEEDVAILPYTHSYSQLLLSDIVAYPMPIQIKDDFVPRKREIDTCLRYGFKKHILDGENQSRLKGNDPILFWSTVSEIKVGMWLEKQGIEIIEFQPSSYNGGKGDFLIKIGRTTVFVEVKTKFGDPYMLKQKRLVSEVAQHFKLRGLPVHSVNLIYFPGNYDSNMQNAQLFRALEDFVQTRMPLTVEQLVLFKDKSGIELEMQLTPKSSLVVSMMYGGFSGIVDELKSTLGIEVNGVNRKLQVSGMDIPSICIIDDFSQNIDKQTIERVLYGASVHDTTQNKAKSYRENDGKWSGSSLSDLSALVVLRFKPLTAQCDSVDAYICPNPKYILPISSLPKHGISWWQLDSDGVNVKPVF